MMYGHGGMNGWGMILMTANTLLLATLVVVGIVLMIRALGYGGRRGSPASGLDGPRRVLADRLARGDIDEEDFHRRLRVLDGTSAPPGPGR